MRRGGAHSQYIYPVQRDTLTRQLETNGNALQDLKAELNMHQMGLKHTYDAYASCLFPRMWSQRLMKKSGSRNILPY